MKPGHVLQRKCPLVFPLMFYNCSVCLQLSPTTTCQSEITLAGPLAQSLSLFFHQRSLSSNRTSVIMSVEAVKSTYIAVMALVLFILCPSVCALSPPLQVTPTCRWECFIVRALLLKALMTCSVVPEGHLAVSVLCVCKRDLQGTF